jgi:glycosyltransferase involved in cell wall biosynthesis
MPITQQCYGIPAGAKFSILIPTWNNLPYLQLCIRSIQAHSAFPHQIIVHVNEGVDGTLDWVRAQRIDYTHTPGNAGVCVALNAAAKLAETAFICFFNDDMYALPDWDKPLWAEIERLLPDEKWFLSSTMIEPRDTGNPCVLAPHDFGQSTETFREADLLAAFPKMEKADWTGSTWPPNVLPKKYWDKVGGYSEEFSPGMSSDPDFSMKLWQEGVRHFKGIGASKVYHFQTKSTSKIVKNDGPGQFLRKWRITQGTFNKYFLHRGESWKGPLPAKPYPNAKVLFARIKAFFKLLGTRA